MNSVISAATIEARNCGWDVLGIMDGFQHLIEGRIDNDLPPPGGVPTFGFETARVAREYMIQLDREDLADPDRLGPIAAAAGLTPEAFRDRHGYLAGG